MAVSSCSQIMLTHAGTGDEELAVPKNHRRWTNGKRRAGVFSQKLRTAHRAASGARVTSQPTGRDHRHQQRTCTKPAHKVTLPGPDACRNDRLFCHLTAPQVAVCLGPCRNGDLAPLRDLAPATRLAGPRFGKGRSGESPHPGFDRESGGGSSGRASSDRSERKASDVAC
jgi:hypothetical protein